MSKFQESIICVGCGAEITWGPLLKQEQPYCCEDGSNGLPCECATPPDRPVCQSGFLGLCLSLIICHLEKINPT